MDYYFTMNFCLVSIGFTFVVKNSEGDKARITLKFPDISSTIDK